MMLHANAWEMTSVRKLRVTNHLQSRQWRLCTLAIIVMLVHVSSHDDDSLLLYRIPDNDDEMARISALARPPVGLE